MKTYHDIIPLARHTDITDTLKRGCRDLYSALRRSEEKADRDIPLTNTVEMDPCLLQSLVSFLTFEKVDYSHLVEQRKSPEDGFWARLFGGSQLVRNLHDDALMDLRRHIASQDSIPWLESHVHFWRDLDVLYKAFDETDRREMNAFFELLMGKPYTELVSEFSIKVDKEKLTAANVMSDEHHYTTSLHLDSLIREDCACSLFSLKISVPIADGKKSYGYDGNGFDNLTRDFESGDYQWLMLQYEQSKKTNKPKTVHPRLTDFRIENPGFRFETLEAALFKALQNPVPEGYYRNATVRFRGERVILGELRSKSFTVGCINPPSENGVTLNKETILEAVLRAEEQVGFDNRMDDFLSTELGL